MKENKKRGKTITFHSSERKTQNYKVVVVKNTLINLLL